MARILAIEGTDIRDRVLYCQDCRMVDLLGGEYYCNAQDRMLDTAEIEAHHAVDFYIDPRCPLPEKTDREVPDEVRAFGGVIRRMYSVVHHCEGTHDPPPTVIKLGCGCILARKKYVVWSADEKTDG